MGAWHRAGAVAVRATDVRARSFPVGRAACAPTRRSRAARGLHPTKSRPGDERAQGLFFLFHVQADRRWRLRSRCQFPRRFHRSDRYRAPRPRSAPGCTVPDGRIGIRKPRTQSPRAGAGASRSSLRCERSASSGAVGYGAELLRTPVDARATEMESCCHQDRRSKDETHMHFSFTRAANPGARSLPHDEASSRGIGAHGKDIRVARPPDTLLRLPRRPKDRRRRAYSERWCYVRMKTVGQYSPDVL